ncbi:hypothetical protein [Vibrio atlanticus]|uniref:Uncharacterized protein n=1 Tax=Vibrio atlanticus TaxID=693153 RepID=A0A1C3IKZ9_9VIBR|nr:hypothetical protein [Vibrio atlanticus]SBS62028.1 hypothetical protein VAT7223_00949 [Vibrio atlanticus]
MGITLTGGYHLERLSDDSILMKMNLFQDSFLIRVVNDQKSKHVLIFNGEYGKRQDLEGVIFWEHHHSEDFVQSVSSSIEEFIPNQRCALALSYVLDGLLNGNEFKEIRQ